MDHALPTALSSRSLSIYRYYVLGLFTLTGVLSWIDRQVFSITLESIKHEFRFTDTQLGLLGGIAFGLFYASVGLPLAWVADRFNRRNLVAASLALWSAMTAFGGFATGFGTLFLARMGVGIGEAGGAAPAQSILSDYYAPRERGAAMGLLYTYIPIGYVVAYAFGGWANDAWGWRYTFIVFGLPGILVALLVRFTIREPARGASESIHAPSETPSILAAAGHLLRRPTLRHLPLAGAIHGLGAFGAAVWLPAFFIRTHGMTSQHVGADLALLTGTAGLAGVLFGGFVCDKLATATNNQRWYLWLPAVMLVFSVPFTLLAFRATDPLVALAFYAVPTFCNQVVLGPIVATLQNLADLRRRAMVAALYMFLANLISMGFGPVVIGAASDFFNSRFGTNALRYSLSSLIALTCCWAAVHLWLASRTMIEDMRHARGALKE